MSKAGPWFRDHALECVRSLRRMEPELANAILVAQFAPHSKPDSYLCVSLPWSAFDFVLYAWWLDAVLTREL